MSSILQNPRYSTRMQLIPFIIILWTTICNPIHAISEVEVPQPLICSKENSPRGGNESINTLARNFKDFVRNSDIFVDKSLLVNLVTENSSFISLTYPRKWGKTINLDMLKTFLEIEVDSKGKAKSPKATWSYKFFKDGYIDYENGTSVKLKHPPMIAANKELMDSYLGRYPVIYVNLTDSFPVSQDFNGFMLSFQKRIADAFQRHEYLIEGFGNKVDGFWASESKKSEVKRIVKKFRKYQTRELHSMKDIVTSLEFLSYILNSYFNQRVYILMNDYDALMRELHFGKSLVREEMKKILHFLQQFMTCTFEVNNENVRMGIVTGVLNLHIFTNHTESFATINYNLLNKNTRPPFGFTQLEVIRLLEHHSIDEKNIEAAFQQYGGYGSRDPSAKIVNDPWSIVNFVNERKIRNFRSFRTELKEFPSLFYIKYEINENFTMNDYRSIEFEVQLRNLTFEMEDLFLLSKATKYAFLLPGNDSMSNLICKYLFAFGCFTSRIPRTFNNNVDNVKLVLPNKGIFDTFGKECGVERACDISMNTKRAAEIIFKYFKFDEYKEVWPVDNAHKLEQLHKECMPENKAPKELWNFRFFHLLLLQHMKSMFNYDGTLNVSRGPYLVLRRNDHRAIIEFEFFKTTVSREVFNSVRIALNRAKRFNSIFENEATVRTSFIGIGFSAAGFHSSKDTHVQIDTNPKYD